MTSTLIIGLVFLAILLIFLIVSFFTKEELTSSQYNTLHFLTSLCAGFSGGFITGDTLLKIDTMSNGLKIGISGTAGFAMFFLIWFTYQKYTAPIPKDTFNFSIPNGWTFMQTSQAIAQAKNSISSFVNFTSDELNLILDERTLNEKTANDAIEKLKNLNNNIPAYIVNYQNNTFIITKI